MRSQGRGRGHARLLMDAGAPSHSHRCRVSAMSSSSPVASHWWPDTCRTSAWYFIKYPFPLYIIAKSPKRLFLMAAYASRTLAGKEHRDNNHIFRTQERSATLETMTTPMERNTTKNIDQPTRLFSRRTTWYFVVVRYVFVKITSGILAPRV